MARSRTDDLNVWPAFTDTMLAFVLVLVLMVAYQVAQFTEGIDPEVINDQDQVRKIVDSMRREHDEIDVSREGNIQNITFGSDVTFKQGSADLSESGVNLMRRIARTIVGANGDSLETLSEIQVGGHTDDVPINNYHFQSNWELSTARATRVVESLIESGIDPEEVAMSATGYGQYQSRASNDTEQGRRKNRRIEIRLFYTSTLSGDQE